MTDRKQPDAVPSVADLIAEHGQDSTAVLADVVRPFAASRRSLFAYCLRLNPSDRAAAWAEEFWSRTLDAATAILERRAAEAEDVADMEADLRGVRALGEPERPE